jgi:ribosomal protein L11 methyltransferase
MYMKYYEVDFNIKPENNDAEDILTALSGDAGFESFNNEEGILKGYVQRDLFDEQTLVNIIFDFPIKGLNISYKITETEDRDWNEEWEESGFQPIIIDKRCSIHDTHHMPDKVMPIDITIDAKLAFGTGTHETTRMIAESILDKKLDGYNVLDCGCGTGILSFIASKCGANSITGYDIDEWSVRNADHNAKINSIENFKTFHGDCTLLAENKELIKRGPFNLVIANINRNILIHDMPWFKDVMKKDGQLILSGFYQVDAEIIIRRALEFGISFLEKKVNNDWCCCIFQSLLS